MALINLPDYLMTRHMNWHQNVGRPAQGGRRFPPNSSGAGQEFLDFHHQFMLDFHAWYDSQPDADQDLIQAWPVFPDEVKGLYDQNFLPPLEDWEAAWNGPQWYSAFDDLGLQIEPIHNQCHPVIAAVTGDQMMASVATSPQSSFFYRFHGLIDIWRQQWLDYWQPAGPAVAMMASSARLAVVRDGQEAVSASALAPLASRATGPDLEALVGQLARRVTELELGLERHHPSANGKTAVTRRDAASVAANNRSSIRNAGTPRRTTRKPSGA
jgi:hypothetical protein